MSYKISSFQNKQKYYTYSANTRKDDPSVRVAQDEYLPVLKSFLYTLAKNILYPDLSIKMEVEKAT